MPLTAGPVSQILEVVKIFVMFYLSLQTLHGVHLVAQCCPVRLQMTHFSTHAPRSPTHPLSLSAGWPITSLIFSSNYYLSHPISSKKCPSSKLLLFQPRERGRMRFHAIQNVETALRFLRLVHWLWQKFLNFWKRTDPPGTRRSSWSTSGGRTLWTATPSSPLASFGQSSSTSR